MMNHMHQNSLLLLVVEGGTCISLKKHNNTYEKKIHKVVIMNIYI